MNNYIQLTPYHISLAAGFVLIAGIISALMRLGLVKSLFIGAIRTAVQLGLAGVTLGLVFGIRSVWLVVLLAAVMIFLAGREAVARQKIKLSGTGLDVLIAMALSSTIVSVSVTGVVISCEPWWTPHLFIPMLGMILGNSLTGISLALDSFLGDCKTRRREIEDNLTLGANQVEATLPFVRKAIRTGMMPMINSMSIVGIVSLPGMMTGQLLAGADPKDAVMYQIVVMYMLVAATTFGSILAVWLARRRVFTDYMAINPSLYIVDR